MIKLMKRILLMMTLVAIIAGSVPAEAATMSARRQAVAKKVYKVVRNHWKDYGAYPSLALAIGVIESGMGESCRGWNMWGLGSGRYYYSSIRSGTIGYMKTINLPYYSGAPHAKTAYRQLTLICKGGYYGGDHSYYRRKVWRVVKMYGLKRYDKCMKRWLRKHGGGE